MTSSLDLELVVKLQIGAISPFDTLNVFLIPRSWGQEVTIMIGTIHSHTVGTIRVELRTAGTRQTHLVAGGQDQSLQFKEDLGDPTNGIMEMISGDVLDLLADMTNTDLVGDDQLHHDLEIHFDQTSVILQMILQVQVEEQPLISPSLVYRFSYR